FSRNGRLQAHRPNVVPEVRRHRGCNGRDHIEREEETKTMITMIYAAEAMTVNIQASEAVSLEQVDSDNAASKALGAGEHSVQLGRGVFRVLSKKAVGVTVSQAHIVAMNNKDWPPPDPPKPFVAMRMTAANLEALELAKD